MIKSVLMMFAIPVVTILISIPLVLRLVPPNRLYGFRTERTLSSPEVWYSANYYAGVSLTVTSLLAIVVIAVVQKSGFVTGHHLQISALLISVIAIAVGLFISFVIEG